MAESKPSGLIKFQFLLFGILFVVLLIWGSGKCSRTLDDYETERMEETIAQLRADSLARAQAEAPPAASTSAQRPTSVTQADTIRGGNLQIIRERSTPLYVTIDGLALRAGPGLHYDVLDRLKLYEEVNFLQEVTDSLYEIKLGSITPKKPWVKVRSPKGRDGWVYGAGVDYYKYKLEGVE
ncbi:MAG: SH3 domain-containing protein [Bacteroidetes bacterium]|nr:MAG: SH3 domain-containing protein [Bacteroidota bacterium]